MLVVVGHPRRESLTTALAEAFAEGAREAGCDVKTLYLSELAFDPDVIADSPAAQTLEPDLAEARGLIAWAEHLVFAFPNWWGTMPARLKGFLDRILYPGFAFREEDGHYYGLLAPRTAELLITMDVPPLVYRWIQGAPGHRAMARATLGLCGIRTVRITTFAPPSHTDAATREGWVTQARGLGLRLRGGPRRPIRRRLHEAGRWLLAVRPQFYPMSVLAYTLGALLAAGTLDLLAFVFGLVAMVGLKVATVLTNDLQDFESDAQNRFFSPFNGGGRSLLEGGFSPSELWRGVWVALGVSALGAVATLVMAPSPVTVLIVLAVLAVLALGYTLPPLKLSHRGLGELDVAVTHGPGVLLLGHVVQGGSPFSGQAWFLALVIALAVLPAILLAGIPDRTADRDARKQTLVVQLGTVRSVDLAIGFLALSALAALALVQSPVPVGLALSLFALPHAAGLIWLLLRYRGVGAPEKRIDLLVGLALLYVAWFVIVPFVEMV
ncbi:NAD(P)H-dependent oxidoreductase [Pararhodobacter sp. SW119]|uniref:NAD(P)H-dependent oxidoreductase n=1 Tax=Pararhodobacter sp. SW119 TaxID=2780075 RepID=UPI001ADF363A